MRDIHTFIQYYYVSQAENIIQYIKYGNRETWPPSEQSKRFPIQFYFNYLSKKYFYAHSELKE